MQQFPIEGCRIKLVFFFLLVKRIKYYYFFFSRLNENYKQGVGMAAYALL